MRSLELHLTCWLGSTADLSTCWVLTEIDLVNINTCAVLLLVENPGLLLGGIYARLLLVGVLWIAIG